MEKEEKHMYIIDINPSLKETIDDMKSDESLQTFFKYNDDKNIRIILYGGEFVGLTSIEFTNNIPEVSTAIFSKYQRQGLATMALDLITKTCFEQNYPLVTLKIDKENIKALNQVAKNGFIMDDTDEELNPDNKKDTYYWFYKRNPSYDKSKPIGLNR